ncbi:chromate transporter [Peribacillus butanolivorans]|uniref:chromate transporter n=1 Tax=Peribacillus butanolivorans TaxID=421767 RepID=UPI0030EC6CC9
MLGIGYTLPGLIATKMAVYNGFQEGGYLGSFLAAVFATVASSLILMLTLMGLLYKFGTYPQVKRMTLYVKPTIAVLLGVMAFQSFYESYFQIGIGSYLLKKKSESTPWISSICFTHIRCYQFCSVICRVSI